MILEEKTGACRKTIAVLLPLHFQLLLLDKRLSAHSNITNINKMVHTTAKQTKRGISQKRKSIN